MTSRQPSSVSARSDVDSNIHKMPGSGSSGLPSTSHAPSSLTSPQRSRDVSPIKRLRSPTGNTVVQERAELPNSGTTTPSKVPNTTGLGSSNRAPRPVSLNEASNKVLKAQSQDHSKADTDPRWPISPRLKSPVISRQNSNADASDLDNTPRASHMMGQHAPDSGMRSPPMQSASMNAKLPRNYNSIAATLETVQEGDQASSPTDGVRMAPVQASQDCQRTKDTISRQSTQPASSQSSHTEIPLSAKSSISSRSSHLRSPEGSQDNTESEADTGRSRQPLKQPPPKQTTQSQPPSANNPKRTALGPLRTRPGAEVSSQSMIVETETVPSIPQSSIAARDHERGGAGRKDEGGSLRARPSTETIRPKKERRKVVQKRPSVVSGASTKADLFEAKVSTNDEESESDDTYVYESNPPETRSSRLRSHSRTPSGTSVQSFPNRRGARNISNHVDNPRGVKPKRSMKFASSSYIDRSLDDDSTDHGTVRACKSKPPSLNVSQPQQGHSSHWPGGDQSPFSPATRGRQSADRSSRNSPKSTPKHSPPPYSSTHTPSKNGNYTSHYSDQSGCSNEREPLMGGSLRAQRTRPFQRPHSSNLRHIEYYQEAPPSWWARRCSGCLVFFIIVALLAMCVAAFVYATTKPLYSVSLLDIQNVLASEEELMLDLNCVSINPNLVPITVTAMDVNVFAKSRHVGTDAYWRHHGAPEPKPRWPLKGRPPFVHSPRPLADEVSVLKGVDRGTDPIDDPEGDPQTMLLGRILALDSPLIFDASPLRRLMHNSTGELRLQKPGNKTEIGGSERWEKVLQHPFQLVVRGVLKYELPLSSRLMSSSISKTVEVDPDKSVPGKGIWQGRLWLPSPA